MKSIEEIKKARNLYIQEEGDDGFAGLYYDPVDGKKYYLIFSYGGGWEHASVSTHYKCPSWDVMCRIKDLLWNDDECCVEYHPIKSDYVNNHPFCLHIWRPINETLPTPPKEYV